MIVIKRRSPAALRRRRPPGSTGTACLATASSVVHSGASRCVWRFVAVPIAVDVHKLLASLLNARATQGSHLSREFFPPFFSSRRASICTSEAPPLRQGGEAVRSQIHTQTTGHALTPRITSLAPGRMRKTEKNTYRKSPLGNSLCLLRCQRHTTVS